MQNFASHSFTSVLLAAVPGTFDLERAIHMRFEHLRIDKRREWFRYEGELRDILLSAKNAHTEFNLERPEAS